MENKNSLIDIDRKIYGIDNKIKILKRVNIV